MDLSNECSHFYFKEGDKLKSALSKCLLSLAYQMPLTNAAIRDKLLEMQEDDVQIDEENHQSIWRKLFMDIIFQENLYRPHFWVIDALDESRGHLDFFRLISNVKTAFPLRIFVTSRPSLELRSQLQSVYPPMEIQGVLPENTIGDIKRYIENHTDFPFMQEENTRQQLISTVLDKSEVCFLWVGLVPSELRKVHSDEATKKILKNVPQGMNNLYSRVVGKMSTTSPYMKPLVKAILTWTVCSMRPLSTVELKYALELDVNDTVHNLESQIASICGHFVYVDSQLRVKMIHQTARSFLMDPENDSEFAFSERDGHWRLAMTCLKTLSGDEMKAPRSRRPSAIQTSMQRPDFVDCAAKFFYEHVNQVTASDWELLKQLYLLLSSPNGNVQS